MILRICRRRLRILKRGGWNATSARVNLWLRRLYTHFIAIYDKDGDSLTANQGLVPWTASCFQARIDAFYDIDNLLAINIISDCYILYAQ